MKAHTLWTKVAAGLGAATLALAVGACSHQPATAGQNSGQIRTEAAAQQQPQAPEQVVGSAPAPANTQAATPAPSTPAIISGPAVVDNSGNTYTSSSVGSAGNASSVGTNTNVNIVPTPAPGEALVTTSPAPVTSTVVETAPAPAPAPAPVVETPKETPAPPMTSSTTTETPTTTTTEHHRRLRKD